MALKITLKPNERMIIGGAVITNGKSRCEFFIENKVPVLRQKEILGQKEANTPGQRIYFTIQLMYIDEGNLAVHHQLYWQLVKDYIHAAPRMLGVVDQINEHILNGRYYQALKLAKKLIQHEQEVIDRV